MVVRKRSWPTWTLFGVRPHRRCCPADCSRRTDRYGLRRRCLARYDRSRRDYRCDRRRVAGLLLHSLIRGNGSRPALHRGRRRRIACQRRQLERGDRCMRFFVIGHGQRWFTKRAICGRRAADGDIAAILAAGDDDPAAPMPKRQQGSKLLRSLSCGKKGPGTVRLRHDRRNQDSRWLIASREPGRRASGRNSTRIFPIVPNLEYSCRRTIPNLVHHFEL